jgi:uncharacterized phiE125 gp8 family phage protein
MLRDILWEDACLVPPAVEPLTLETVREQRRLRSRALDARLDAWRRAARQQFEEETGLQLITATRQFSLERFPLQPAISVGRAPVQSILAVQYLDPAGDVQELDPAQYDQFPQTEASADSPPMVRAYGPYATPGGIQLVSGATWPTSADRAGAVRVVYQAGFGDTPDTIPDLLRYALLQYVGDFHRWSENQAEGAVALLPIGTQMIRRQATGMMRSARRLTRW